MSKSFMQKLHPIWNRYTQVCHKKMKAIFLTAIPKLVRHKFSGTKMAVLEQLWADVGTRVGTVPTRVLVFAHSSRNNGDTRPEIWFWTNFGVADPMEASELASGHVFRLCWDC